MSDVCLAIWLDLFRLLAKYDDFATTLYPRNMAPDRGSLEEIYLAGTQDDRCLRVVRRKPWESWGLIEGFLTISICV